jgi:light-regulated signal transduction histidine kinase (bacteriophytochrome)
VALQNLVNNAWKFTSKTADARIEFGCTEDTNPPEFYVRDNGAGFDMAYVNKLFGAFQRLHAMEEFTGTGIGLATVQRIMHRHGGFIRAEGALNKGATFYFTLGEQNCVQEGELNELNIAG